MVFNLYHFPYSAPSRTSLLTVHALGLENDVEVQIVDLVKGEQNTPEYLKINPLHLVPALEDEEFVLCDSHAINTYLVDKYGDEDDSLYPKDLQKRAIVNQMLYYENGVITEKWKQVVLPLFLQGATTVSEDSEAGIREVYSFLEKVLESRKYIATDEFTLADIHFVAWITTTNILVPAEPEKYPKLSEWLKKITQLPYFKKVNKPGIEMYEKFLTEKLNL